MLVKCASAPAGIPLMVKGIDSIVILGGGTITVTNDGHSYTSNTKIENLNPTKGVDIAMTSGEYNLNFLSKENILDLRGYMANDNDNSILVDISQFNWNSVIQHIQGNSKTFIGNFKPSAKTNLSRLGAFRIQGYSPNYDGISADLSDFSEAVNLNIFECNSKNVVGNIESLAKCTLLETLYLTNTLVTGEVNTLAAAQVANGRDGTVVRTLTIDNVTGLLTHNGTPITSAYVQSQGGTSKTVITFDSSYTGGYQVSFA